MRRFLILLFPMIALAQAPPGHLELTFSDIGASGYNFYMDDCAVTGAVGLPVAVVSPGTTSFVGLLPDELVHSFCVRGFNSGLDPLGNPIDVEQTDPGQVSLVSIAAVTPPGPVDDTTLNAVCTAPCTVNIVIQ